MSKGTYLYTTPIYNKSEVHLGISLPAKRATIGAKSDMYTWKETCARTRKRHIYMKWDLCSHESPCSGRVTCQNRPKPNERGLHQSQEAYTREETCVRVNSPALSVPCVQIDLNKSKDWHQSTEAYAIQKDLYKKKRSIQPKEANTIKRDQYNQKRLQCSQLHSEGHSMEWVSFNGVSFNLILQSHSNCSLCYGTWQKKGIKETYITERKVYHWKKRVSLKERYITE